MTEVRPLRTPFDERGTLDGRPRGLADGEQRHHGRLREQVRVQRPDVRYPVEGEAGRLGELGERGRRLIEHTVHAGRSVHVGGDLRDIEEGGRGHGRDPHRRAPGRRPGLGAILGRCVTLRRVNGLAGERRGGEPVALPADFLRQARHPHTGDGAAPGGGSIGRVAPAIIESEMTLEEAIRILRSPEGRAGRRNASISSGAPSIGPT